MDATPYAARPVRHANALALVVFALMAVLAGALFAATGDAAQADQAPAPAALEQLDTSDNDADPTARGGLIAPPAQPAPAVPAAAAPAQPAQVTATAPVAAPAPTTPATAPTAEQPTAEPAPVLDPCYREDPECYGPHGYDSPLDEPTCPLGQGWDAEHGCVALPLPEEVIGRQVDGPNGQVCTITTVAGGTYCTEPQP